MSTPAGLACLFAVGLALRIAILAIPRIGLVSDVNLFRDWSQKLATAGPRHFYERGYFANYPPGYMYVLLVVGRAWREKSSCSRHTSCAAAGPAREAA